MSDVKYHPNVQVCLHKSTFNLLHVRKATSNRVNAS
jgi:hypothetical protein